MMTGFFFMSPLPPACLFSSLLLLVFSSSVLVESRPLNQGFDSRILLQNLFRMEEEAGGSLLHGEGLAEAVMSSLRYQRDSVNEAEPLNATEREADEFRRAWPHLLLDIMGQQNRFKGRTRKDVRGGGGQVSQRKDRGDDMMDRGNE